MEEFGKKKEEVYRGNGRISFQRKTSNKRL
jgi:hypothetical protein